MKAADATAPLLVAAIKAFRSTDALPEDPDDPSIWINKVDTSRSLIIGTMKAPAPDGGLAVFGLDGKLRQFLKGADRPNNVDVEITASTWTPRPPISPS